jgi:hypothetical protein
MPREEEMAVRIQRRTDPQTSDDRLNDEFHVLLRDAAAARKERAQMQSSGDANAAREESDALLALARGQRTPRPPER